MNTIDQGRCGVPPALGVGKDPVKKTKPKTLRHTLPELGQEGTLLGSHGLIVATLVRVFGAVIAVRDIGCAAEGGHPHEIPPHLQEIPAGHALVAWEKDRLDGLDAHAALPVCQGVAPALIHHAGLVKDVDI